MSSTVAHFESVGVESYRPALRQANNPADTVLQIRNATQVYTHGKKSVVAYNEIDLDLRAGEIICLLGPSGCGKSSLLRIAAGLEQPQQGEVRLHGTRIQGPDPRIGVVFQDARLLPWLTVRENIALPFRFAANHKRGLLSRFSRDRKRDEHLQNATKTGESALDPTWLEQRIDDVLARTNLTEFQDAYPTRISGGMAQRVALARSLVRSPEIILCDEPFAALDALLRMELQQWLAQLVRDQGASLIFVTHDIEEALYLADRIVVLTPHPGNIADIKKIDLPHPRQRDDAAFFGLRSDILQAFRASQPTDEPQGVA